MTTIQNQTFDQERALYGKHDLLVRDCSFAGPADGESAFKECTGIQVEHSFFDLRYPFWHDHGLTIRDCELTDKCRAALWYSDHITIEDTKLHGIKALRECADASRASTPSSTLRTPCLSTAPSTPRTPSGTQKMWWFGTA